MIPVNSSNFNSSSSCSLVGVYEIYRQHMILDLIFHSVIHPGAHKACLEGRGGGGDPTRRLSVAHRSLRMSFVLFCFFYCDSVEFCVGMRWKPKQKNKRT